MAGNEKNDKLDPSPCEDEAAVKEGRKRRAEILEEDVDGNRSRAKNVFRHFDWECCWCIFCTFIYFTMNCLKNVGSPS